MTKRIITVFFLLVFTQLLSHAQPNVVIFYADDLGWGDLSVNNKRAAYFRHTPNIDRIFNQGIRLDNFVTHCVCSPSRAGLLTGKHFTTVANGPRTDGELPNDVMNFAKDFKLNGYSTGFFGKWHNGNPGVPAEGFGREVADYDNEMIPGDNIFDYPADYPFGHGINAYGFDRVRGYYGGGSDMFTRIAGGAGGHQLYWWHDDRPNNEPGYTTDLITQYANEFIEENQSNPFVCYVPQQAVHNPLHIKLSELKELCDQFPGEWDFIKNKASPTSGRLIKNVQELKCSPGEEFDYNKIDTGDKHFTNLVFAAYIYSLDKSVGSIVQKVTDLGLFNDTIFFFASDNGALPQGSALPFQGGKHSLWEGGVHVPAAVWWPGTFDNNTAPYAPGNNRYNGHIGYMDFYPTIMDMAGLNCTANGLEGLNCWPDIQSNTECRPGYENPYFDMWRDHGTVRTTDYKLFYSQSANRTELYDLKNDPDESNNVADARPNIRDTMINLYKGWINSNNYAVPFMRVQPNNISHPNPAPSGDYLEVKATQTTASNNSGVYLRFATGDWIKAKYGYYTEPGDRLEYDIFVVNDSEQTKGFFVSPAEGWTPIVHGTNGVNQNGQLLMNLNMPKGQWMRQIVGVGTSTPGPSSVNYIAFRGSAAGYYHFYLDNVVIRKKDGDIRTVLWQSAQDNINLVYRYKNVNHNTLADAKAVNGFPFSQLNVSTVRVTANDARFVSVDAPRNVEAGETFTASITVQNTGTTNWAADSFALGSQGPQDNNNWGTARLRVPAGVSIPKNAYYTFDVDVTAPATAGSYLFQWKMIELGVQWFGEVSPSHSINVTTAPGTNLLLNRSFENGVPTPNAWNLSSSGFASIATNTAHEQSNSLRLSSGTATQISPTTQTINNLKANTDYRLKAWFLNSDHTGGRVIVDMNDKPTAQQDLQFLVNPGDAPVWTEYTGVWNSGSETSVTIRIFTNGGFIGTAFVDYLDFSEMPDDPYAQWKTDNGITDDNGDKDNDGIANLLEYALGSDPGVETSGRRPVVSEDGNNFEFKFKRERAGIIYTIEKSTDLINWTFHETVNDGHGAVGSDAVVPVSVSEMNGGKLFLRLKVEN